MVADPWCPYNCTPGDAKYEGFLVELVKKALEPLGYTVVYKQVPWTDAIADVRKGQYDIVIGTDPDESPGLLYPHHATLCGFGVFTRKGEEFAYTGPYSLGRRRLGVVEDYFYGQAEADYIRMHADDGDRVQVMQGTQPLEDNLAKMEQGQMDVLFENAAVLKYKLAQKNQAGLLSQVGVTSTNRACYLAFTPAKTDGKDILDRMEDRTDELEADGTLPALRKKYGLDYVSVDPAAGGVK